MPSVGGKMALCFNCDDLKIVPKMRNGKLIRVACDVCSPELEEMEVLSSEYRETVLALS